MIRTIRWTKTLRTLPPRPFSRSARRSGAAATEFVIALPLLIALTLTAVDFGRIAYATVAVNNAARVGAERGATRQFSDYTYAAWRADIESHVMAELQSLSGSSVSSVTVDVATSGAPGGLRRIDVAVECTFATVVDWPALPQPLRIRRNVCIRQFR